jgi:hypothetical protein
MDELRKPPASERFDLMAHHLLDAQEAAQILRMDRRTLIVWARLGYVPAHPLGEGKKKMWRFPRARIVGMGGSSRER